MFVKWFTESKNVLGATLSFCPFTFQLMLFAGVRFSSFPQAGATYNALVFASPGFSLMHSQGPQGLQSQPHQDASW